MNYEGKAELSVNRYLLLVRGKGEKKRAKRRGGNQGK